MGTQAPSAFQEEGSREQNCISKHKIKGTFQKFKRKIARFCVKSSKKVESTGNHLRVAAELSFLRPAELLQSIFDPGQALREEAAVGLRFGVTLVVGTISIQH